MWGLFPAKPLRRSAGIYLATTRKIRTEDEKATAMKSTKGWRIEESGWWAHDELGGVCRESDGKWYGYHKNMLETERIGPFKTAREASEAIEKSDDDRLLELA